MREYGAPPEDIEAEARHGVLVLLADNWESWVVFIACASQWRYLTGLGSVRLLGLDYSGVDLVVRRWRVGGKRIKRKLQDQLFSEVQDYERGALEGAN